MFAHKTYPPIIKQEPKRMPDLKVISMDDDELELENTIRQLIERKDAAVEGSAEYRMVIRQLKACATAASWLVRSWKNTTIGVVISGP